MKPRNLNIFHGPINIAGIGRFLAEEQCKLGYNADFIPYERTKHFADDPSLDLTRYSLAVRWIKWLVFFIRVVRTYNVFHFYFGKSLLFLGLDLPILRLFGKRIIMTYCGSDVRMVANERKRNPYADRIYDSSKLSFTQLVKSVYTFRYSQGGYDWRKRIMIRYHNLWVHRFFVIRDCMASVEPYATSSKLIAHIPIHHISAPVVTREAFEVDLKRKPSDSLTVVHAPSNPKLKGTSIIEDAINQLIREGVPVRYVKLMNMPHEEVVRVFREEADVVIDQVLIGSFGSITIEAMAYGVPIMVYVLPEIREKYVPDMPFVDTRVPTLVDDLRHLLEDEARRLDLRKRSWSYVREHYDRKQLAEAALHVYQETWVS